MKTFWMLAYRLVYYLSTWIWTKKIAPFAYLVAVNRGQRYEPHIDWRFVDGDVVGFIQEREVSK
jgi:hypothetical protein